jgi:uncharacterized protein
MERLMRVAVKRARNIFASSVRPFSNSLSLLGGARDGSVSPLKIATNKAEHVVVSHHSSNREKTTVLDLDKKEATRLIDYLLKRTRKLMGDSVENHLVAFSGGIDSSVVAAAVHAVQTSTETAIAVLGVSNAVPEEQVLLARRISSHIGIPLTEVPTTEGSDDIYIANAGQACLACKTHLYSTLSAIAAHAKHSDGGRQLYNGTNSDDLKDPTRLGLIAAENFKVLSPLRELTKAKVRVVARHMGLPNWNYAASPCLRSRLALGVEASVDHLHRIERAERFVKTRLSNVLDESSNLRVRLLAGNRACVEVDQCIVDEAEQVEWETFFMEELNFSSVGVRAFRSGSVSSRAAV